MKKTQLFARSVCVLLAAIFYSSISFAQSFIPGVSPEQVYPPVPPFVTPNPVNQVTHTSNSQIQLGTTGAGGACGFSTCNVYCDWELHGWDDPNSTSGFAWQCEGHYNGVLYDEGFMLYPQGVRDIEVQVNTTWSYYRPKITVAYYNSIPGTVWHGMTLAAGHYYDTYEWTWAGLTYLNTQNLSFMPFYTRISIAGGSDEVVIVWEDRKGIYFTAGVWNNPSITTPFTTKVWINNSFGETKPDVSLGYKICGGSYLGYDIHFVYQRPTSSGLIVTKSLVDFFAVSPPATVTTWTPTIQDINVLPVPPAGSNPDIRTTIDCNEENGCGAWAYVYTDYNYNEIHTRIYDPAVSGSAYTFTMTDGSQGIPAIDNQYGQKVINDWPTICFNNTTYTGGGNNLYIGWHTWYDNMIGMGGSKFGPPTNGGYVGLKLKTGGGVTSPLDYLYIPTDPNYIASKSPSISFCKEQGNAADSVYMIYTQVDPNGNTMIHKKHSPWNTTSTFKTTGIGNVENDAQARLYPNPAHDMVTVETGSLKADVYRIFNSIGQLVANGNVSTEKSIIDIKNLQPGVYRLQLLNSGTSVSTQPFTKQ